VHVAHVDVKGTSLAYDDAGSGPAVILIHAGIADRQMWDHQFIALSAHHRVVRYDWSGRGESGDPAGEVAHHEDLLALMDALDIDRASLVGCSYGGAYAIDAGIAAPHRVTSLTLICSGLSGHEWPPEMLQQVRERVHSAVPAERLRHYQEGKAERVDPADVKAMAEAQVRFMVAGPDRDAAELDPLVWDKALVMCRRVFERQWSTSQRSAQRWLEPPAKERLDEINVPTLVINGLADVPQIQQVSQILTYGISHTKRIDLPNTGHLPPVERPEEITRILTDFLSEAT
jgi:pimeloyl-ACP methyl ester carboxylesterase